MITVFGLGFVGLTTALGFAHYGYKVYGIDVDENKKSILRAGKLPFLEEGLDDAMIKHLGKNFEIIDDVKTAIKNSDIIFYCVGTPYGKNGEADLQFLFSAIKETLKHIDKRKKPILVIKSTIPPSTTSEVVIPYIEKNGFCVGNDLLVANNPEFLREGHCWDDFINADRIVIGCDNDEAVKVLTELYAPFNVPICPVSYNTGEFIKYLSNTLLATMISYSNEMSVISDAIGNIDVAEAFHITHMDKRWNNCNMTTYLYPGCGYGGYCLPKDTNALYSIAKEKGIDAKILGNVINLNDNMPQIIAERIENQVNKLDKVGILGLSFKPNSNDVRDCASAKIIDQLICKGYNNIYAYDPVAIGEFKQNYNYNIEYIDTLESICKEANVLVILTAWEEFREIKKTWGKDKLLLDFRYME
nr:nucleotide sugar dehydrogenase [Sedimentibacter sp.]